MTVDGCCARVGGNSRGRRRSHRSNVHCHIAVHQRRSTLTTTKDNIVIGVFRVTYRTANQRYSSILRQYTIDITAAIDRSLYRTAFNIDSCVTLVLSNDSILRFYTISRISSNFQLSQATTKDTTIDSTAIDVNGCCLVRCRIYLTEGRAAIDVALHNTSTRVGDTWSLTRLGTHVHNNIAAYDCRLTFTTAIDRLDNLTACHVNLWVTYYISRITTAKDVQHTTCGIRILDIYLGVAIDSRHITTTIHTTGCFCNISFTIKYLSLNDGITFYRQVGICYLS